MTNRERPHRIVFRLTEQEKQYLDDKLDQLAITNREAYCRKMILEGHIVKIDTQPVKEVRRLLGNLTNNINQIAKHTNESQHIYTGQLLQVIQDCQLFKEQVGDFEQTLLTLMKP